MSLTGEPDSPPTKTGLSFVDYLGGCVSTIGLLAGVHVARWTGIGMDCDVNLFDTAVSLLSYVGTCRLSDDDYHPVRTRRSAHPSIFRLQAFETADGWIMIACPKEKFRERLLEGTELDAVANDEKYSRFARRLEFREELVQILGVRFSKKGTRELVDILDTVGVSCGPVNYVRSAFEDPQVAERDRVIEHDHPGFGTVGTPWTAVNVGDQGPCPGPAPAEKYSEEVLKDLLGYSDDRVERLDQEGTIS